MARETQLFDIPSRKREQGGARVDQGVRDIQAADLLRRQSPLCNPDQIALVLDPRTNHERARRKNLHDGHLLLMGRPHRSAPPPPSSYPFVVRGYSRPLGVGRLQDDGASTVAPGTGRASGTRSTAAFVSATPPARIFAGPPSNPFHRKLRRIRCLLRRFDCYWASDPSQAGLPPARMHMHSRRTVGSH